MGHLNVAALNKTTPLLYSTVPVTDIMDRKSSNDKTSNSTLQDTSIVLSPPPPYSTNTPPQNSDSPSHPPHQSLIFPKFPPQSYHTQAPIRTLHVNYGNWNSSRYAILDTDEHTPLYDLKTGLTKPQMTFSAAAAASSSPETTLATVTFHTLHTHIDALVNDRPIKLTTHRSLKSLYTYASPALQGAVLTWKSRNTSNDLECVDEKGLVVARFHFKMSMKKAGRLEIMDARAQDGDGLEEMMVTGLAFAYYMEMICIAAVH